MKKFLCCVVLMGTFLYGEDPILQNCQIDLDKGKTPPLQNVLKTEGLKRSSEKKAIKEWEKELFGLTPYRENYILPFGYTNHDYKEYTPTDGTYSNYEAQMQVSLKFCFAIDPFGWGGHYYGAYSQRSFWQLYITSKPFRETNYNPEVFAVFPLGDAQKYGLKSLEVGYSHLSNGQGNIRKADTKNLYPQFENRSRSINYLYTKFLFQTGPLLIDWKILAPIGTLEDNPDIMKYYGYTHLKFMYFYKKNLFYLRLKGSLIHLHGSAELSHSYPIMSDFTKGIYLYSKIFSGYGESLIDYNTRLTKVAVGVSFSR